jgi:hypothetical protein
MVLKLFVLAYLLGACCAVDAQIPDYANRTLSPFTLPGRGLAQHDFLYAGESHDRKIFIVRQGTFTQPARALPLPSTLASDALSTLEPPAHCPPQPTQTHSNPIVSGPGQSGFLQVAVSQPPTQIQCQHPATN